MGRFREYGPHRAEFERNKKKIYATKDICAICGKPVDKSLPFPHPLSKTVDHIIPVDRGGHMSDINNLQLAHMTCNRAKSNKLPNDLKKQVETVASNRILPLTYDWTKYKG